MNARCYRCGWSFSMSREAIVAAVTTADAHGEKFHVELCPKCKLAIKLPLDQLRRALPPGWTPAVEVPPSSTVEAPGAAAAEPPAPLAETSTPSATKEKARRRHAAHKPE
jgi:hypothetical protein